MRYRGLLTIVLILLATAALPQLAAADVTMSYSGGRWSVEGDGGENRISVSTAVLAEGYQTLQITTNFDEAVIVPPSVPLSANIV